MFDWLRKNLENIFETPDSLRRNRQQAVMHAYLAKVNPLLNTQRYEEALSYLNGWIEDDATNYVAFQKRGYCNYLREDYEDAVADFTESIRIKPHLDHRFSYFYRAWSNYFLNNCEVVVADCNRVLERTDDENAFLLRGAALHRLGQNQAALDDANQVIAINQNSNDGYVLRTAILVDLDGDPEAIIADCNRALDLKPENPNSYLNRSLAYITQRQYDVALADLDETERNSHDPETLVKVCQTRGRVFIAMERYSDALEELNRGLKLYPDNPGIYYQIGRAHYALDDAEAALNAIEEIVKINPNDVDSIIFRASIYGRNKQLNKAYSEYEEAIEKKPEYDFIYVSRANIRVMNKQHLDEALADINWAMTLRPQNMQLYFYRGRIYLYQKQLDAALNDYQNCIDAEPWFGPALKGRAQIHFLRGNYTQALADFEQQAAIYPHLTKYGRAGQAVTLYAMGKQEEAIARWREIVAEDSRFCDVDWLPFYVFDAEPLLEIARKLVEHTQKTNKS